MGFHVLWPKQNKTKLNVFYVFLSYRNLDRNFNEKTGTQVLACESGKEGGVVGVVTVVGVVVFVVIDVIVVVICIFVVVIIDLVCFVLFFFGGAGSVFHFVVVVIAGV